MATTVEAKCTDMPPTGRSIQAPGWRRARARQAPARARSACRCAPLPISLVKQGCYRALPMDWEGGAHTPADMLGKPSSGRTSPEATERGDLRWLRGFAPAG
jgi:hypothetical protein